MNQSSSVSEQLPLSPEMVLTAAREVVLHLHSLNKPYSAGVVTDCILTIENLLSRDHAQCAREPALIVVNEQIDRFYSDGRTSYPDAEVLGALHKIKDALSDTPTDRELLPLDAGLHNLAFPDSSPDRKATSASPCLNCGDPSDELFCGMCREMGCSLPSTEGNNNGRR